MGFVDGRNRKRDWLFGRGLDSERAAADLNWAVDYPISCSVHACIGRECQILIVAERGRRVAIRVPQS